MTIRIWCPRPSETVLRLRDAIRAQGVPCYRRRSRMRHIQPGDMLINWGSKAPLAHGDRAKLSVILNDGPILTKRTQLIWLALKGVHVPEVFDGPGEDRIGRSNHHAGGDDLLTGTGTDYYTQRLDIVREIRVHVFRGKSIRAGMKVHREGFANPHPWIRSFDAGWRIDYGVANHKYIKQTHRDLAKRAIEALRLDFGAVDVALVGPAKVPVVLEVNLAPGLEGKTLDAYVRHILACQAQAV